MNDSNPYQPPRETSPAPRRASETKPLRDHGLWLWGPMLLGLGLCLALGRGGWGFGTFRGEILIVASALVYLGGILRILHIFWWQVRVPRLRGGLSAAALVGFLATVCIAIIVASASSVEQVTSPRQSSQGHWSSIATVLVFAGFYEFVWWPLRRNEAHPRRRGGR